jgi:rhamnosyltransferase subunit B
VRMAPIETNGPRVLILTAGSHGDVFPFVGLGRALQARGARVGMLVNPYYAPEVRSARLEMIELGERLGTSQIIRQYGLMHPAFGAFRALKLFFQHAPEATKYLRAAIRDFQPDVVLAHHVCIGAHGVAQEAGIPCALGALSPSVWFSDDDPIPSLQQSHGAFGRFVARMLEKPVKSFALPRIDAAVNKARQKSGLPPRDDAFRAEWRGGDVALGLWSPRFRAPQQDDPRGAATLGFVSYDGAVGTPDPAGLEKFLAAGDPPILFTLGTTAVHVPGDFYRSAIAACRALRKRAILLAGQHAAELDRPEDGVKAFGYVPLSKVAPRCAATVVHGGIGTTAQALRAGTPTLVVPFAHDQFNNGVRVAALGVGDAIPATRLSTRRLTAALSRLLSNPATGREAASLGTLLRGEDGAANAAAAVLALVKRDQPATV